MNSELEIKTNNLPEGSMSSLAIIQNEREALINAYDDVIGLKITEDNLKTFKELRLQIRDNRTKGIEPWHTTNKAVSLAIGRTIDAIKNREVEINKRMEAKLLGAEKHFENLEKERVEKLNKERIELVRPYLDEVEHLVLHDMEEDVFNAYLETKKRNFKAIQEAEAKAEKERIQKEENKKIHEARKESILPYWDFVPLDKRDKDFSSFTEKEWIARFNFSKAEKEKKDESIRLQELENERLKKEAEEKEALRLKEEKERLAKEKLEAEKREKEEARKQAILDKEKEKQDAILKKEREAKAKLEAELKANKEAELKVIEDKKAEELKAKKEAEELAKSPIKKQLNNWVESFNINNSPIENELSKDIQNKFNAFKKWANSEIEKL